MFTVIVEVSLGFSLKLKCVTNERNCPIYDSEICLTKVKQEAQLDRTKMSRPMIRRICVFTLKERQKKMQNSESNCWDWNH